MVRGPNTTPVACLTGHQQRPHHHPHSLAACSTTGRGRQESRPGWSPSSDAANRGEVTRKGENAGLRAAGRPAAAGGCSGGLAAARVQRGRGGGTQAAAALVVGAAPASSSRRDSQPGAAPPHPPPGLAGAAACGRPPRAIHQYLRPQLVPGVPARPRRVRPPRRCAARPVSGEPLASHTNRTPQGTRPPPRLRKRMSRGAGLSRMPPPTHFPLLPPLSPSCARPRRTIGIALALQSDPTEGVLNVCPGQTYRISVGGLGDRTRTAIAGSCGGEACRPLERRMCYNKSKVFASPLPHLCASPLAGHLRLAQPGTAGGLAGHPVVPLRRLVRGAGDKNWIGARGDRRSRGWLGSLPKGSKGRDKRAG